MIKALKVRNSKQIQNKLKTIAKSAEEFSVEALTETAFGIHRDVVKSITEHRSKGKAHKRYNPERVVKPSRPGKPPNADTGTLHKSYMVEIDKTNKIALVGSNLKYAAYLEFGTKDIAARPHLMPAFKKNVNELRKKLMKSFKKKWGL